MLPNLSDYMSAFQNPQYILADQELRCCSCPKDQQGQPKVQSGGFALTFCLESPNKKWAVRCFHRDVADRDKRYTAISAKLNDPAIKESGYFVDFDYQPTGVTIKGRTYPIVKMAWATGNTLGAFLESNYDKPQYLRNLRESLKKLYAFLSDHHIAHGDIQPGNLMVSNEGKKIQLIDYDGIFVLGMEHLNAAETGVPNFQHPERGKKSPWNERLDRFPFILLDITLSILEIEPAYWRKTDSSDEKILFEATDYLAPYGSMIFRKLKGIPKFSKQISVLQQICRSDFDDIPPLDTYLQFVLTTKQKQNPPQTVFISYKGNYEVLDATNVAGIASQLGKVVEIVGRIIQTKTGTTQGDNRPYIFINFEPWKRGVTTFRLVLWAEILDEFRRLGVYSVEQRFKEQYVSIVGMVRKFDKYGTTTYQLVPDTASKLRIIDESEAKFRLGKIKKELKQSFGGTMSAPAATQPCRPNVIKPATDSSYEPSKCEPVISPIKTSPQISTVKPPSPLPTSVNRTGQTSATLTPTPSPSSSVSGSNRDKLKKFQDIWDGKLNLSSSTTPQSTKPSIQPKPQGISCSVVLLIWCVIGILVILVSR